MNKLHFEIALYEIFQMVLIDKELLDKRGVPPRKTAKLEFSEQEAISVYKWLGERIKGSKQAEFEASKDEFNKYAKGLIDEVYLNMFLMALFMLDKYIQDEPKPTQILMMGKVERLISFMRMKIREVEDRADEVILDSSMTASNIYRRYNNQAELSRDVRAKRTASWREGLRNKPKVKDEA